TAGKVASGSAVYRRPFRTINPVRTRTARPVSTASRIVVLLFIEVICCSDPPAGPRRPGETGRLLRAGFQCDILRTQYDRRSIIDHGHSGLIGPIALADGVSVREVARVQVELPMAIREAHQSITG